MKWTRPATLLPRCLVSYCTSMPGRYNKTVHAGFFNIWDESRKCNATINRVYFTFCGCWYFECFVIRKDQQALAMIFDLLCDHLVSQEGQYPAIWQHNVWRVHLPERSMHCVQTFRLEACHRRNMFRWKEVLLLQIERVNLLEASLLSSI